MVRLNRIYTRTGDDGTTALGDGARLEKHHPRIAAYGTVDELSSVLGLAIVYSPDGEQKRWLQRIQNELFDVGADLCVPGASGSGLRLTANYTRTLENMIDEVNARLEPLTSFVLPGGSASAAWLHLARTVCRRAERLVTELVSLPSERDSVNPEVVRYLNRLSDLLFVMARAANRDGRDDILWQPGGSQPLTPK